MSCRVVWRHWDGEQNGIGMSRRLAEISDWSERAAAAQWCVTNLAETCGVSLSQLERHFHKMCGQSPRAWLQGERMRRACELLKRCGRINEVATQMGFGHHGNFTRAFAEHFGYSPREHLELRTPNSELRTPNSELRTPNWTVWPSGGEASRFVTKNDKVMPLLVSASAWFDEREVTPQPKPNGKRAHSKFVSNASFSGLCLGAVFFQLPSGCGNASRPFQAFC